MIHFPQDFLWGAATSSYQVEGNNVNADWWKWEERVGLQQSKEACRHYQLYEDDFNLAKELGHNAHRLSIEWSRVQPQKDRFSNEEIDHYRKVIIALRNRGIEPVVTLHHFTNPLWFSAIGGWASKISHIHFSNYVEKIVDNLASHVRFWVTINEPMVYSYFSYIAGLWPPQEESFSLARRVTDNMAFSHLRAYNVIHDIYRKKSLNPPMVSIAQNMQAFCPCGDSLRNKLAAYLRHRYYNMQFIAKLTKHKALDFIGLNYYTRSLVDARSWSVKSLLTDNCKKGHDTLKKNSLGWEIYPLGLYSLLLILKDYGLPVFILENGICTDDDKLRWEFISEHLKSLNLAMAGGTKVLGYLYWSLLDNFEWDKGFAPRFGLIHVDYNTYKRTIRESARRLAEVFKTGSLEE